MAFSWKEKYATIINAQTWEESVEGYKITNVLGLAFNYYLAYTKFITGLDITMDIGLKVETFYARCFKIGSASEYKSNKVASYNLENNGFWYSKLSQVVKDADEKVVKTKKALIDSQTLAVEHSQKLIALEEKSGGLSSEVWDVSKTITSPSYTLECETVATIGVGSNAMMVALDSVSIYGPMIEIG